MNKYVVRIEVIDNVSPVRFSENRAFENKEAANLYFARLSKKYKCVTNDERTGMFWARRMYGTQYSVELTIELA